jgi:pyruvate formate lyase activating enzyme
MIIALSVLIPGENDSRAELEALSTWIFEHLGPDVPLHFTAFHPDWKMLDRMPTPTATLAAAREVARCAGLRHVYTRNIRDEAGQSTYCHACGSRVIGRRDWYDITSWNLTPGGRCENCGRVCAGIFDSPPGSWGARRRPPVKGGDASH